MQETYWLKPCLEFISCITVFKCVWSVLVLNQYAIFPCVHKMLCLLWSHRDFFWHRMSYFCFALWENFMSATVSGICQNGHVMRHVGDEKLEMTTAVWKYRAGVSRWTTPWKDFVRLLTLLNAKTKGSGGAACRVSMCHCIAEGLLQAFAF